MQSKRSVIKREAWAAVTMIVLGLGAIAQASTYNIGSLARMGPGMFPAILGVLLVLLGLIIARTAFSAPDVEEEAEDIPPPEWRGWGCIIGGLMAFILLGKYGGLVPATFALVFIAAMGDRQHTVRSAALLAVGVTILGIAVFSWALQLQFPLFRWG
ncbi:tripartite tricarboxylate transporter TctB family protein [Achromobacter ruhlandii]|uniref:tripartite tricarboxylate transporter TctB family protein n=1 Tax=Achromobacter ruhlandii TaxID=72557 RepID=UPI0007BF7778|nr:tripartite tricarboxylate transporter TctB family protein [Achromobacter ruhlandii]